MRKERCGDNAARQQERFGFNQAGAPSGSTVRVWSLEKTGIIRSPADDLDCGGTPPPSLHRSNR